MLWFEQDECQEGVLMKHSPFPSIYVWPIFRWCLPVLAGLLMTQAAHADTWKLTVGAQSTAKGRQVLAFLPNEIWIELNDSITWTFATDEIHTVTFLTQDTLAIPQTRPPFQVGCPGTTPSSSSFNGTVCTNSGPQTTGATYNVKFSRIGNFKLVCLVHNNMTGVVHVIDRFDDPVNAALFQTQDFYNDEAADEAKELLKDRENGGDLDEGDVLDDRSHFTRNQVTAGIGKIVATPGGSSTLSIMRFFNHTTTIHVGDTVQWNNNDPVTPHTVTFGTEPPADQLFPPSSNVDPGGPGTDGARSATIGSTKDSVHSGFLMATAQDQVGLPQNNLAATEFRVTFTKAGTYKYICALHDDLGMKGKIVVLP
jgi:plastocyanin